MGYPQNGWFHGKSQTKMDDLGVALFSNSPLDDNRRNIAEVREAMYGNAQLLELMVKSMYQQAVTSDPRNFRGGVVWILKIFLVSGQ